MKCGRALCALVAPSTDVEYVIFEYMEHNYSVISWIVKRLDWKLARVSGSNMMEIRDVTVAR